MPESNDNKTFTTNELKDFREENQRLFEELERMRESLARQIKVDSGKAVFIPERKRRAAVA